MQKIKPTNITELFVQLSTLLNAGINLLQALNMLKNSHDKKSIRLMLAHIIDSINQGNSFTIAIAQYKGYFSQTIISLIETAEKTGALEPTLVQIVQQREQRESCIKQLKKALIYPCILLSTAIIITLLLLTMVVPQFQSFYDNFNQKLPLVTQLLIQLSGACRHYGGWMILFGVIIILSLIFSIKKNKWFRKKVDSLLLHIPLVKTMIRLTLCIQTYTLLALHIQSGLSLVEGLNACVQGCHNQLFARYLMQAKQLIQRGYSLAVSINGHPFLSATDKQLLYIAEQAGQLDVICQKLSQQHSQSLYTVASQISSLIEPLILIVLGLVISMILLAIYLPIFRMGMVM